MNIKQTAALVALLTLSAASASAQPKAKEWDTKYVKMDVPETVTADQVFVAKITMKNTGTEPWKEGRDIVPSSLRSQSPEDNKTWGTNFIIQGRER